VSSIATIIPWADEAGVADVYVSTPFPDWALPTLWSWMQGFRDRVMDDFCPQTLEEFVERWGEAATARQSWGVYRGHELGGAVVVQQLNPVAAETHCAFKKDFWGRATTMPALRMVYGQLFGQGVMRISAHVFEDNHQLRALAKALGAVEETPHKRPMRNCTMRNGELIGMRILALFPDEFQAAIEQEEAVLAAAA
jgi:RimJ/RimL family protein N-acetyltransferase